MVMGEIIDMEAIKNTIFNRSSTNNVYNKNKPSNLSKEKNTGHYAKDTDSFEISNSCYDTPCDIRASYSDWELEVSKINDNTLTIRFAHPTIAENIVEKGYININGKNIALSYEMKEKLLRVSKDALTQRLAVFDDYVMKSQIKAAEDEGKFMQNIADEHQKTMDILKKVNSGKRLTSEEKAYIMKAAPDLYMIAIMFQKKKRNNDEDKEDETKEKEGSDDNKIEPKVDGDTTLTLHDTQITVSLDAEPEITDISEAEYTINM